MLLTLVSSLVSPFSLQTRAEEGMWTFDNLPLKQLKEKYGFEPTREWLDHVRLSSVRFNDGGSGSFVSPNGLVMTNHHVAMGQLQKMSTAERNFVATGFYAATQNDEVKCADLELNVLDSYENITDRVRAAVKPDMNETQALKARQAEMAKVEKESTDKTGLRSDIVTLYQGGEYWVYRYKKYTDVRLVMAPERQIAFFGGDADNFTFPRYDLDMTFFRVYENGKAISSPHFLKWNNRGAAKDELVFVSGHPGRTERLLTHQQLKLKRDVQNPLTLKFLQKRIDILNAFSKKGPEQARRALGEIFGLSNSLKAYQGEYDGLLDESLMNRHKLMEQDFKKRVAENPELNREYGDVWEKIADLTKKQELALKQGVIGNLRSRYATIAQTLIRVAEEREKKDEERQAGFHEAQLDEIKGFLFSPAPIYADQEEASIAGLLQLALDELGPEDPFVKTVLNGKAPAVFAKEVTSTTKLGDPAFRKSLFEGGKAAITASTDPFIQIMQKLGPLYKEREDRNRKEINAPLAALSERLAKARFAVYGKNSYPDATFTLRLSFGTVKGYPMNGTQAPYKTTLFGLFDRALSFDQDGDFALPKRYWDRKDKLDLTTPVNFVNTCDIIGGNSGSPVINRNGELVGLIFDGNIESLPGNFIYDEAKNRAVAVHPAFIMEALRKLYDAPALANEIEGNAAKAAGQ
ncbi:MAG: S46 family peptidase [Blastocatellia bacterium]|nr:S46 family peptidase [Blastocatellia bacterium]